MRLPSTSRSAQRSRGLRRRSGAHRCGLRRGAAGQAVAGCAPESPTSMGGVGALLSVSGEPLHLLLHTSRLLPPFPTSSRGLTSSSKRGARTLKSRRQGRLLPCIDPHLGAAGNGRGGPFWLENVESKRRRLDESHAAHRESSQSRRKQDDVHKERLQQPDHARLSGELMLDAEDECSWIMNTGASYLALPWTRTRQMKMTQPGVLQPPTLRGPAAIAA